MALLLAATAVTAVAQPPPSPLAAFHILCAELDGAAVAGRAREMGLAAEGSSRFVPPPPAAWRLEWVEEERLCAVRGSVLPNAAPLLRAFRAEADGRGWMLLPRWHDASPDNFAMHRRPDGAVDAVGVHRGSWPGGGEEVALTRRPFASLPDFHRR